VAVALTIVLTTATLIAFALVIAGPVAAGYVPSWLIVAPSVSAAWNVLRWPLAFGLVVTAIGCIYHFAPDTIHEWIWITPGSCAAASLWLIASVGFRVYVANFADYQKTYGAVGAVMVGLLWFYFTSLALLIGAQLDVAIDRAATAMVADAV
jgi:membrane protein